MQRTIGCQAAEAAGRLLNAIGTAGAPGLSSELDGAAEACRGPWPDSAAEERAELLEAVVNSMREELARGGQPSVFKPQSALLRHLAGST